MLDAFEANLATVELPYKPRLSADGKKGFWSTDEPIFHVDNPLELKRGGMFEPQRKFWNLPNFIKVFVAGYGTGKTFLCGKRAIATALDNAGPLGNCPVAVVSPSYSQAEKTTIPTIKALLAGRQTLHAGGLWWKYNNQSHIFTIKFKGRIGIIYICSGDNPDSLRGPNLAAAYIDEPFIQPYEVFTQMIARVRHPDARFKELGLFGTPEQLNWGWDLCVGDLYEKNDVGYIQASTRSNKAIDTAVYVKRLESVLSPKAAKAYVDGAFVNLAEGMVYYAFDPLADGNVESLLDGTGKAAEWQDLKGRIPEGVELGCGMDFNVNPMSACIFWRYGSHMHYFDEIELPNADTEFMCETLRERYVDEETRITKQTLTTVYPDATGAARKTSAPGGKSDFWYIKQAGFHVHAPYESPKRKDRYNACNGKFKAKSGPSTITIEPRCKKLIKYLSTYSYELLTEQEQMSHLLDAFSYPVSYLFPVNKDSLAGQFKFQGA